MHILKISARNFKNLANDAAIDFVAKSRKTSEDKEYELHEIADGLYIFKTIAIVGKNASGKTTALDLLAVAEEILTSYRVSDNHSVNNMEICIYFFEDGYIYKYIATLLQNSVDKKVKFENELIMRKPYYKSYINEIYDDNGFETVQEEGRLPEDVSKVFFVIQSNPPGAIYYNDYMTGAGVYNLTFDVMESSNIDEEILKKILKIFDANILGLTRDENGNFKLNYAGEEKILTAHELFFMLSSGTTKGMILYTIIVASLSQGFNLIIDEIENHFHKTLVENIISLYKDKSVNRKNATLIFSTHYCELLDLFNRQDNIYIANADNKVHLNSVYDKYPIRNDVLKSRQFYTNVFKTAVNYDALMALKKAMK